MAYEWNEETAPAINSAYCNFAIIHILLIVHCQDEDALSKTSQSWLQEADGGAAAVAWLVSGIENLNLDGKAWAGASHWRYRTRQNPDAEPETANAQAKPPKRATRLVQRI